MEQHAANMVQIDAKIKRHREEITPLKDMLLESMVGTGRDEIYAGEDGVVIRRYKKKVRKNLGIRKIIALAKEALGEEHASKLAGVIEAARGLPVEKEAIKICY